jgi:hypothetical protein
MRTPKFSLPHGDLLAHTRRRRAAIALARGDRRIDGQHGEHLVGDARLEFLQRGERQVWQRDPCRLRGFHGGSSDVVGFAEGDVEFADEPVGEVGCGAETG